MNKKPTIYMRTCDAMLWIVKVNAYLYKKYWDKDQKVVVLGFTKPKFRLPSNFKFLSMGRDPKNTKRWTREMYDVLNGINEEFMIFTLDDYLPIDYHHADVFKDLFKRMKADNAVSRVSLGFYPSAYENFYKILDSKKTYDIFEIKQEAPYRITAQMSIWRKSYLMEIFKNDWSPWEFEITGSQMAKDDGTRMLGTRRKYPYRWLEHSALSGRWKGGFNVLGLRKTDIKELIRKKLIDPKVIQWGIDMAPLFKDVGMDFEFDMLRAYYNPARFEYMRKAYGEFYT